MNTVAWITSKGEQHDIKDIEARRTKLNIEDLPKNLSAFSNDVGFIDNTVNNLINYYKKSETYTKTEIDQKLSAKWDSKFVDELPTEDISTSTIYFLKRKKEQGTTQYENDVYDEYIYTGTWELIGNTYVDLSDYYRKNEVEEVIDNKVLVETNNRLISENEIKGNIENVNNYAKSIENNLNAEISARKVKNLQHETDISANTTAIQAERTRAMGAESTLADRCDTYDSHVANISNPHSVTAEQVGLGNVTNVGTTDTITPNSEENITSGAVYTALKNKVDKIDGRGLSEQNFTYAEKTKLAGLSNYDDTSIKSRVSANESAITTLNGNSSVNGSVDKKIADAIGGVTQIDFQVVQTLPATGVKGVIYFVPNSSSTEALNVYDEYIWVNNAFEKVGTSSATVDLNDYYTKAEVTALVSVKNDKITITDDSSTALTDADTFSTTSNTGTNPTNLTKRPLSLLWNYIKGKISSVLGLTASSYGGKASTAGTADKVANALTVNGKTYDGSSAVDAGVQTVANGGTGATDAASGFNALADGVRDSSTPADNEKMLLKPSGTTWYKTTCLDFWNYIKGKISSVLGLTASSYGGTADYARNMHYQNLDLSALDKTKFYPLVCVSYSNFVEVAICSESRFDWTDYNQNRIHFDISTYGWNDIPPTLNIREYGCYDNNEVTIGCIGRGIQSGAWAIWLRGGLHYTCFSRDSDLSLKTSNFTYDKEVYTIGTNYYGGENGNVIIMFTPQSTIKDGAYSSRPITAPRIKANYQMVIPIGAPSSIEDGCIWIS